MEPFSDATPPAAAAEPSGERANDSTPPDVVHLTSVPPTKGAEEAGGRDRLHVSRQVAALAGRQHGAVSTAQLLELGFTHHDLVDAVAGGRLHRVHRGVY